MRSGEKERLGLIRMITAAIKQREVDERITLDDAQVLDVLEKMIKQRKESLVQFQAGNRQDLVEKEAAEITLLQGYLPSQLSDAEIDALISEAIAATGAASIKDMGKVMAIIKGKAQGRADLGTVGAKIKAKLGRLIAARVHGRPHSTGVHRRDRRAFRYRRDHRRAGTAEKSRARIQGLLPLPQREITLLSGSVPTSSSTTASAAARTAR